MFSGIADAVDRDASRLTMTPPAETEHARAIANGLVVPIEVGGDPA